MPEKQVKVTGKETMVSKRGSNPGSEFVVVTLDAADGKVRMPVYNKSALDALKIGSSYVLDVNVKEGERGTDYVFNSIIKAVTPGSNGAPASPSNGNGNGYKERQEPEIAKNAIVSATAQVVGAIFAGRQDLGHDEVTTMIDEVYGAFERARFGLEEPKPHQNGNGSAESFAGTIRYPAEDMEVNTATDLLNALAAEKPPISASDLRPFLGEEKNLTLYPIEAIELAVAEVRIRRES